MYQSNIGSSAHLTSTRQHNKGCDDPLPPLNIFPIWSFKVISQLITYITPEILCLNITYLPALSHTSPYYYIPPLIITYLSSLLHTSPYYYIPLLIITYLSLLLHTSPYYYIPPLIITYLSSLLHTSPHYYIPPLIITYLPSLLRTSPHYYTPLLIITYLSCQNFQMSSRSLYLEPE